MVRRALVVEFGALGHHADYLGFLADAWDHARPPGAALDVLVTPGFVRHHPDLAARMAGARDAGLILHVLGPDDHARLKAGPPPVALPLGWLVPPGPPMDSAPAIRWEIARRAAQDTGAERLFFMELDAVLACLAARCATSVPVSGILFRYPCADDAITPAHRRWLLHQRALVAAAFRHPRFGRALGLDPRVADEAWAAPMRGRLTPLVDPLPVPVGTREDARRQAARESLGIPEGRTAVLQFGHMAARKGQAEVLAALAALDEPDRLRMSLLLFGARVKAETAGLDAEIDRVRGLGVHVAFAEGFVGEDVARDLFDAADLVTVLYRSHAGMSGVLLRAAAAGVPVLAQSTGLIGHLVRRHRLGRIIDTRDASAIVSAFRDVLAVGVPDHDAGAARAFARSHDPSRFQRTLLEALFEDRAEVVA